jgi:hypothetical protein
MTKGISFLYSPLVFILVDREAFFLKAGEHTTKEGHMRLPNIGEKSNVVNIDVNFIAQVTEDLFHDFLTEIRGFFTTIIERHL